MISSLDKTLHYLNCVSKENHHLEFAKHSYELTAKEEFCIRPSMFCHDECLSCGQCCRNYDTIMFPTDLDEIKRRAGAGEEPYQFYLDNMKVLPITVDGNDHEYLSVAPMSTKDNHDIWCDRHTVLNCRWIFLEGDKKYCKIHEYRCITCGFPHMELYPNHVGTKGYLGHKQFGRNWQLGCKVDIRQPWDESTKQENIYWLRRLQTVADYLEVNTYLPEILETLINIDIDVPPKSDITFKLNRRKQLFNI